MKTSFGIILAGALFALSCSKLTDELPAPVAPGVNVHDASWSSPSDAGFHGRQLGAAQPAWNDQTCRTCHGGDYRGGTAGVACFKCHDPYPHSVMFPRPGRHVGYMISKGFPLVSCQGCHGQGYTGGPVVAISCEQSGCHVDASGNPKSPETCNTCHGTFSAPVSLTGLALINSAAPPRDVDGDTTISSPGVGAHQKHLFTGTTGRSVKCVECHVIPASVSSPGHLNAASIAVFNDTLANLVTGNGSVVPHPSFDENTMKCANTYCHGNWVLLKSSAPSIAQQVYLDTATVMVGARTSPVWTAGSAEGQCWSCHGTGPNTPTPAGHQVYETTACYLCHGDVVDASGNISNRAKHMNGVIDLVSTFGGPRQMR